MEIRRLKNLPTSRLLNIFVAVSAAMMVLALALAPADGAAALAFVVWTAGALILLGLWTAIGVELARRFFGSSGGGSNTGAREERSG